MGKHKNLQYIIPEESLYHGEGHIINIAKRHTNRRWRQYTPEKQCKIALELVRLCNIHSIELKGFGTFIIQISFKDIDRSLVTQLRYNLNFQQQDINQTLICDKPIKYVDLKLINNELNPRRMGINHFFMKGETIRQEGEEESDGEQKKKKKRETVSEIWVRQKVEGEDPWGVGEGEEKEEDRKEEEKKKERGDRNKKEDRKDDKKEEQKHKSAKGLASELACPINSSNSKTPLVVTPKRTPPQQPKQQDPNHNQPTPNQTLTTSKDPNTNKTLKKQSVVLENDRQMVKKQLCLDDSEVEQISKAKKKRKEDWVLLPPIQLQLPHPTILSKPFSSPLPTHPQRFQQKLNLKHLIVDEKETEEQQTKDCAGKARGNEVGGDVGDREKESQEQKKIRVKMQLIKKLQQKMNIPSSKSTPR